jgi:hypothetical protein
MFWNRPLLCQTIMFWDKLQKCQKKSFKACLNHKNIFFWHIKDLSQNDFFWHIEGLSQNLFFWHILELSQNILFLHYLGGQNIMRRVFIVQKKITHCFKEVLKYAKRLKKNSNEKWLCQKKPHALRNVI